jgi:hypothetical protein
MRKVGKWVLGALALAALCASAALAAPGFTAPVTLASNAGCAALSTDTVSFLALLPSLFETRVQVAALSPAGELSGTETLNPAGTLSDLFGEGACPVASQGYAVVGVIAKSGAETLYGGTPGTAPARIAAGEDPAVALRPDGSGVIAWIGEAPGTVGLPEVQVFAARRASDGSLGTPQALGPPGTVQGGMDGIPIIPPSATVDADGTLTVAWSLLKLNDPYSDPTLEVSQALPGAPFGAPQPLEKFDAGNSGEIWGLKLAGDGLGHHLVAWEIQNQSLEPETAPVVFAEQTAPGRGFHSVHAPVVSGLFDDGVLGGLAMDSSGVATVLERTTTVLAVSQRPTGGAWSAPQLFPTNAPIAGDNTWGETGGASLAVAPGGDAALAFVSGVTGPGDGSANQLFLASAPPGGRFGAPQPITGLAADPIDVTAGYDAAGLLRLVWDTPLLSPTQTPPSTLDAAFASPGAPDPLAGPPPHVVIGARAVQHAANRVVLSVSVDSASVARIQAVVLHAGRYPLENPAITYHTFTGPGRIKLSLDTSATCPCGGGANPRRLRVRLVVYASTATGASGVAARTVTQIL